MKVASVEIIVNDPPSVIFSKLLQPEKAWLPMNSTDSGTATLSNDVHSLDKGAGPNDCQGLRQSDACQVVALYKCLLVDSSHRLWDCHRKHIFAELEGETHSISVIWDGMVT